MWIAPRTKGRIVFISALALLCLSGVATFRSFVSFRDSERWVSHTQEIRAAIGDFDAQIAEASRARVAYLMSGDDNQLIIFRAQLPHIDDQLKLLRDLSQDNPVQTEHCRVLQSITDARIRSWEESIGQKQQGGDIDLSTVMRQSLDYASQSAAIVEEIRNEEIRLLQQRVSHASQRFDVTRGLVILSFALAFFLLYFHYRMLASELHARAQAERAARNAYAHEAALRQEEERFRVFVEAVRDYAMFMLDTEGHISSWNAGAERLNGYPATEILGQHFSCFFPDEDIRARKPQHELEVAAREGRIEAEGWRIRKDGSRFWANITITAIRDDRGKLIGFAKITRDFTERMLAQEALRERNAELANEVVERKAAEERLAASARSLRELSFHLLRTQDEERKRIGRDLHDSLGQYLAALKMSLDSLQLSQAAKNNGLSADLANCIRLAEDSIREMRTISYLLYPPMLEEMGLKSAIRWYIEGFSKRSEIETAFEADESFDRLAPEVELALFRVLQEGLTNVHRHSGSDTASVKLFIQDGRAFLEIEDKGKGFPSSVSIQLNADPLSSSGVGLRGMTERMRQFGGELTFSSTSNGTVVMASVPVERVDSEMMKSA